MRPTTKVRKEKDYPNNTKFMYLEGLTRKHWHELYDIGFACYSFTTPSFIFISIVDDVTDVLEW